MKADFLKLVNLLKIDQDVKDGIKTQQDAIKFIIKFRGPVRDLLTKKDEALSKENPEKQRDALKYYEQFDSLELLKYLSELKIKNDAKVDVQKLKKVSAVFGSSGQLITLYDVFYTLSVVLPHLDLENVRFYFSHLMALYPEQEQKEVIKPYFEDLGVRDLFSAQKYTPVIFDGVVNKHSKAVCEKIHASKRLNIREFMNTETFIPDLIKTVSSDLPDESQTILIITSNPQQFKRLIDEKLENKKWSHNIMYVKYSHPEYETMKGKYFNEEIKFQVGFLMRDLAEEITETEETV